MNDPKIEAALRGIAALDGDMWTENARHFTHREVVALANLLVVAGDADAAAAMYESWIESEIEDGECEPGDWVIVRSGDDVALTSNREDEE